MKHITDLRRFTVFIYNFDDDWIEQAWKSNPSFIPHFKEKWEGKRRRNDSTETAMLSFIADLDVWHQTVLETYIKTRYPKG